MLDRHCRKLCLRQCQHHRRRLAGIQRTGGKSSQIDFWAKNIIVENGGKLIAGTPTAPFGSRANVLTIYLYGPNQSNGLDPNVDANQGQAVLCQTKMTDGVGPCGIPTKKTGGDDIDGAWSNNGTTKVQIPGYPNSDYFYQYGPLWDTRCTNPANPDDPTRVLWKNGACTDSKFQPGYFGYKVLGVSYGGTLQFFGYKGTPLPKGAAGTPASLLQPLLRSGVVQPSGNNGRPVSIRQPERSGGVGAGLGFSRKSALPKSFHSHLGNGGGGNGGGGNGGGGVGGDEGTCASLKVGTNTVSPDTVPTSIGCSWLRLGTGSNEADNLAGGAQKADLVRRDG